MGMKIERNQKWTAFEDLKIGAIFIDTDDEVNIKAFLPDEQEPCAVVLDTGHVWYPTPGFVAKEVHPTLVIDKE